MGRGMLRWHVEREVLMKNEIDEAILYEMERLDSLIEREALVRLAAELYEPTVGGFYYSLSAKNNEGFYPDIESTAQMLVTLTSLGLFKYSDIHTERFPDRFRDEITRFFLTRQDKETGFFFDTQFGKAVNESKKGRNTGQSLGRLSELGVKPLYPTPAERTMKKDGTESVLADHYKSLRAYRAWLDSLDWQSDDGHKQYYGANMISASRESIAAAGYLDFGFWHRLNVDLELYYKHTSDMLMEVPEPYSTSGFGYYWDNVGAMVNKGVELNAMGTLVATKDFLWTVNANVSYNHNRITELYNGVQEYERSGTNTKLVVGHPLGEFYINRYAGVNPANGDALWYTKDGELTNELRDEDKVLVGKSYIAPWQGGFGTALSWKGLSLTAQFSWVADRWMLNNDRYFDESNGRFASYNQSNRLLERWQKPGDVTDIPRHGVYTEFDSRLLEDASFLRLKNLMLGYSIPEKAIRKTRVFSGIRVYAQAQNLLTFTKFSGLDPEGTSNVYAAQYPMSRQFTFGVDITF